MCMFLVTLYNPCCRVSVRFLLKSNFMMCDNGLAQIYLIQQIEFISNAIIRPCSCFFLLFVMHYAGL